MQYAIFLVACQLNSGQGFLICQPCKPLYLMSSLQVEGSALSKALTRTVMREESPFSTPTIVHPYRLQELYLQWTVAVSSAQSHWCMSALRHALFIWNRMLPDLSVSKEQDNLYWLINMTGVTFCIVSTCFVCNFGVYTRSCPKPIPMGSQYWYQTEIKKNFWLCTYYYGLAKLRYREKLEGLQTHISPWILNRKV